MAFPQTNKGYLIDLGVPVIRESYYLGIHIEGHLFS